MSVDPPRRWGGPPWYPDRSLTGTVPTPVTAMLLVQYQCFTMRKSLACKGLGYMELVSIMGLIGPRAMVERVRPWT